MRHLLALFLVFAPCLAAAADQVDPAQDLSDLYPQAGHVGLAIAIVPDPHVPRYRRVFDLDVQAITLGMLDDGYVLDRYVFPWTGTGEDKPKTDSKDAANTGTASGAAIANTADRDAFGLMIFRCDGWRGNSCGDPSSLETGQDPPPRTTRIRAVYFVTDTATWGVAASPLRKAVQQIRRQLAKAGQVSLLQFPGECTAHAPGKTLVMLGPSFSGAMDSVGQHLGDILSPEVTEVCLVSGFTTVTSNQFASGHFHGLRYARMALQDNVKLLALARLAQSFGYFNPDAKPDPESPAPNREVAFLAEASTFGYGICSASGSPDDAVATRVEKFCRDAQTLYFPAAIADIRYGLDQQRERQKNNVQTAVQVALPSDHLTLDAGAENGSEFPENRQSKLTAASQQLALDHVLDQLEQTAPKMVVVVATDVRDRLFLFDQLRQRLPSALLIDLETDILLAHPDFLHASRGAITVASANLFVRGGRLFGCERGPRGAGTQTPLASWALDGQGLLADAVSRLDESTTPQTPAPCIDDGGNADNRMPILHVVTLKGLRRISRAFAPDPASNDWARREQPARIQRQINLSVAQWVALLCCIVIVAPWLWVRPIQHSKKAAAYFTPQNITCVAAAASIISWAFAMFAAYCGREDPESGYALAYWSAAILALALGGLYLCVKRVHESGAGLGRLRRRYRWAIAGVGLLACALAAVPVVLRQCSLMDASPTSGKNLVDRLAVDQDLLTGLALDIGQGLAYHVVTAVGVVTVLFTMISLATGACLITRNNDLLAIRPTCKDCDSGARTPHFPSTIIVAVVLLVALIAAPSLVVPLGGPRLSIFGPWPSLIAATMLFVATLSASILTMVAIHLSRRIRTIAGHIGRCVTPKEKADAKKPPAESPGFWPANSWQPNLFAATPVVARVSSGIVVELNKGTRPGQPGNQTWKTLIREFLGKCDGESGADDGIHRRAVFALLASEISLYRWFVCGAVLCSLASVCAAYLFPIEADPLLMWNLAVLVVHALLAGYVATAFERDGVLSNILCNRPRKAEFSAALFTYAALPFFALGFAIAVSQVPGVVDWGGGVLALLAAIGMHP